jgi:hypothetical protein
LARDLEGLSRERVRHTGGLLDETIAHSDEGALVQPVDPVEMFAGGENAYGLRGVIHCTHPCGVVVAGRVCGIASGDGAEQGHPCVWRLFAINLPSRHPLRQL